MYTILGERHQAHSSGYMALLAVERLFLLRPSYTNYN